MEKNEEVEMMLNDAYKSLAGELHKQIKKTGYMQFLTPYRAKIEFIKFKYYNEDYIRCMSLCFHPQQLITAGDDFSIDEGLEKVANGQIKAERLRFVTHDKIESIAVGTLAFGGARLPTDFPASLSRSLIEEFGNNGKILDGCSGWGGRLVGFLASNAKEYQGCDASPYQVKGDLLIYETYKDVAGDDKIVNIECSPFEKLKLKSEYYDMALTSPPYFDREKYLGGEQSREKYNNYEHWKDGFYTTLIKNTYKALKHGGVFCLQVGSQVYPLLEDGKKIATSVGFEVAEVRATDMTNNFNGTETMDGEVVLILKKK